MCPCCGSDHDQLTAARIANDNQHVIPFDCIDNTQASAKKLPFLGDRAIFRRPPRNNPWFEADYQSALYQTVLEAAFTNIMANR